MDHDETIEDASRRQLLRVASAAAVAGFTARVLDGATVRAFKFQSRPSPDLRRQSSCGFQR